MLVLIATDETHRHPHEQVDGAIDGELVAPVVLECADVRCRQCQQGWFGLASHRDTSTAMVVERPGVDEADLRSRIHDWLDCRGAIDLIVQASEANEYEVDGILVDDPVAAVDELVSAHIVEIRAICARYPVGTVVSRLGQLVAPRQVDLAA